MGQASESTPQPEYNLFARAREGDEAAWEELVERCYDKVRRVVRHRLAPRMRSIYDSTDITNDVFKSLIAKQDRFEFPTVEALEHHLKKVARQKVIDEQRRHHADKRNLNRLRRLTAGEDGERNLDVPGSEPTASKYAQAKETRDLMMTMGESEEIRELLALKVEQHCDNQEVSERMGWPIRKVQRALQKVKQAFDPTSKAGGDT